MKRSIKTLLYLIVFFFLAQFAYALNIVELSPGYYPQTAKGKPLALAYIYVGTPDLDPTIVANQKTLSVQQEDGTIVAVAQPIRTNAGGVPTYLGESVVLLVEGDYSLAVLNSSSVQVYYVPSTAYEKYLVTGNYYYPDATEADQGVVGGGETITDILATVGAVTNATIYFSHDSGAATTTYTFTTNTAITDNFNIIIEDGVILNGAGTLTINGPLDVGLYQVFGSSITIVFGTGAIEQGNVRWWGALGDDTNDDTAEIQAAVVACLSTTGGDLLFPDGTYKITSEIIFVQYNGFKIHGQSQGGTFIKQYTSDTPIFKFTTTLTHTFEISDFYFQYDTQQTSTESESVAIYFTGSNCTYYNFQVRRCQFDNVYKGIGLEMAGNPLTVWGCSFDHLWHNSTCTGPVIDMHATTSIGKPNISANHIYVDASSIENAQPIFRFQGVNPLQLDNIEINLIDNGATALVTSGSTSGSIGSFKVEGATYAVTDDSFFDFSNTNMSIEALRLTTAEINIVAVGGYFSFLRGRGGTLSKLDIKSIDCYGITLTDGDAWISYGLDTLTRIVIGTIHNIEEFYLTNIESTGNAGVVSVEDWNRPSISADNGDADLTIAVGDEQVQMFESALTGAKVVTLPEHEVNGTNVFEGLTYKIVRTGGGAFDLTVDDNDSVTIGTIANGDTGALTIMYRRLDWELIGDETW